MVRDRVRDSVRVRVRVRNRVRRIEIRRVEKEPEGGYIMVFHKVSACRDRT